MGNHCVLPSQYAYNGNIDSLERHRYWSSDKADPDPDSLATCIFKMPKSTATEWANLLDRHIDQWRVTAVDCIAALISVEISEASYANSNASAKGTKGTMLTTAVDARSKVTPRASESCFGNIVAIINLMISSDKVVPHNGGSTPTRRYAVHADVAMRLCKSANSIDNSLIQRQSAILKQVRDPSNAVERYGKKSKYNTIMFIPMDKLGADISFNIPGTTGKPRWVRSPWLCCNNSVAILPRQAEGDWEIQVCLKKWHMDALRKRLTAEKPWGFTVVEDSYDPDDELLRAVRTLSLKDD